jgi:hypothetical protein
MLEKTYIIKLPIIKFKNKQEGTKGFYILCDNRNGFYGNRNGEFFINNKQLQELKEAHVIFEEVIDPTESYPWENVLMQMR